MRYFIILLAVLSVAVLGVNAPASAQGLRPSDIQAISESVVLILAIQNGELYATGSGTIVEPTGLIYTNHHVIEDADDFEIYITREIGELPEPVGYASLVKAFNEIDFAILQIDRDTNGNPIDQSTLNLPAINRGARTVSLGDHITVFGYPSVGDGYLVITQGSITSVENSNLFDTRVPLWYRTDAEFSPGNSGGLVVDNTGAFLGIPTMVRSEERTLGRLGGVLPFIAVETVLNAYAAGLIPDSITVTLNNASSQDICYLYLAGITAEEWGQDLLGNSGILRPGSKFDLTVAPGVYDVLMQDCQGQQIGQISQRELTETSTINFPDDTLTTAAERTLLVNITEIETDVAVDEDGALGVKVHTEINAVGYLNQEILVSVSYFNSQGTPISCRRLSIDDCDASGNLSIQAVLTPTFEDTIWDDYWFWIPYSGLPHNLRGKVDYIVEANIGPNNGTAMNNPSPQQTFTVDYGAPNDPLSDLTVSVTAMEFDTTGDRSEDMGVRTYVDITATGHKDAAVRVAVFFYWEDGSPVACDGTDRYYCDPSGNLTVQEVINPSFDSTIWTDYWMHVPYGAFPGADTGTHYGYVVANISLDGESEMIRESEQYTFELYYN